MVLRELTALAGVSGDESAVRAYILEKACALADAVRVDRMGNVLATKRAKREDAPHVMLLSHMDEVGLMVVGVDDDGLLAYEPVGGIDPRVMVSKRVLVGKGKLPGVIGAKAIHLQRKEDRTASFEHRQLFIDIGAKDKKAAEALVAVGDMVNFVPEWTPYGDELVRSKALDDRIGCYNLLRLMRERFDCTVTYAFTVQEEVGLRGARVAAQQMETQRLACALVLEGTTANDLGDVPPHMQVCRAGKGVTLSFMDRTSIAHTGLFCALRDLAEQKGIAWQLKTFVSGGNDAGAVQTARGAVATCTISVPCRYIHSPSSACSLRDIESQYELARAFLEGGAAFEI